MFNLKTVPLTAAFASAAGDGDDASLLAGRRRALAQALSGTLVLVTGMFGARAAKAAEWSVGVQLPGLSIGVNVPRYPRLVQVPGYPVYYAPGLSQNYFFYDGLYWVYQRDNWYASTWYDGPWGLTAPDDVPLFVLRVPVRYYRSPPTYFRGWRRDAPPRWGDHWGRDWHDRRQGWDHWDRRRTAPIAPLPSYQRQYPAGRYPRPEQQQDLHQRNYRYQRRDDGRPQGGGQDRDRPGDHQRDQAREPAREPRREAPREQHRQAPREQPQERPRDRPQEQPQSRPAKPERGPDRAPRNGPDRPEKPGKPDKADKPGKGRGRDDEGGGDKGEGRGPGRN